MKPVWTGHGDLKMTCVVFSMFPNGDIVGCKFLLLPMKYSHRSVFALLAAVLVSVSAIAVLPMQAQLTWSKSQKNAPTAVIQSVQVTPADNEVTLQISSSRPITPQISLVDAPPRLVIDLPHTIMPLRQKRFNVRDARIKDVRVDQYDNAPPAARAVVDLLAPLSYTWENTGNQLIVHLRLAELNRPATVPSLAPVPKPDVIPVTQGSSGAVMLAGSRIAGGSAVTAGSDTAVLRLARGGEVRICPGTTVSVTPSQNGRDLMLGMNTGAMEAHYTLQASADSILTPDFRMMLAGPGEFDFAVSSDTRGNTCVRSLPGNTASVIVSELMGDGTYQVRPGEQVVFHTGNLAAHDANAPASCGCPKPRPATMLASNGPSRMATAGEEKAGAMALGRTEIAKAAPSEKTNPATTQQTAAKSSTENSSIPDDGPRVSREARVSVALPAAAIPPVKNPDEAHPSVTASVNSALPPSKPNEVQVEVDAPFVFRATDPAPDSASSKQTGFKQTGSATEKTAGPSPVAQPATIALPLPQEAPAKPIHHGFFGKVKGFFSAIFR